MDKGSYPNLYRTVSSGARIDGETKESSNVCAKTKALANKWILFPDVNNKIFCVVCWQMGGRCSDGDRK